jgi:medium-chain acyl-[acyl-carrier-protein] hydrolase
MNDHSPWLIIPRPQPQAIVQLACFHHAGAGASAYRMWAALLPPTIELAIVQLPGRETRLAERPMTSMTEVVEHAAAALSGWVRGPYVLFGHSLGARLAFLSVLRLQALGALPSPRHLVLSGAPAPLSMKGVISPDSPSRLTDADLVHSLGKLGGTMATLLGDAQFREMILPVLKADGALCAKSRREDYTPTSVPITIFRGARDALVDSSDMEEWQKLSLWPLRVVEFEGGHFFIQSHRGAVLQSLKDICEASAR